MRRIQLLLWCLCLSAVLAQCAAKGEEHPAFQTSDRCIACHNGLSSSSGEDVSIGFLWRASMMANSSRDPYWQASARRESVDHPDSQAEIEDECSVCHMPITRYEAHVRGEKGEIFSHLPFNDEQQGHAAKDGVSCSVCHQISERSLGTESSFNGGFVVDAPVSKDDRREYGPYDIKNGQTRIMTSSTEGYHPTEAAHIRDSKLCATCHTLYTIARGPEGKAVGKLPEQMPYVEWLNSDYAREQRSCQSCHMPTITEDAPIAHVLGVVRPKPARHVFVAGNFFMQNMLNRYRDELSVSALPAELTRASEGTLDFLHSQTARVAVGQIECIDPTLHFTVSVENVTGHKLPTAYPARRAWLHVVVRDRNSRTVFESGAVKPDGSITGNDNDDDPKKFEPHYQEIHRADQVQIYESILADPAGSVTTGLIAAVGFLKDNRLLPHGFDKQNASSNIAVRGDASRDQDFTDAGDRVRYVINIEGRQGPFSVEAELCYQPIGYRWANNLKPYDRFAEPNRFNRFYDSMASSSWTTLAKATGAAGN